MARRIFFALAGASLALILGSAWLYPSALWALILVGPLIVLGLWDAIQTRHTILRNFPLIGHLRYLFEAISPEIQQYFIERHTDGTPISRNHRAVVYVRSKAGKPTHPFGTELDLYDGRYQGFAHSAYPVEPLEAPPRVRIGGEGCAHPYSASLLNVSAMSFGAISSRAILALGQGARAGGFYVNTGEGGLSRHHLESGCDLVWQIGTGYFGCRDAQGRFDPAQFADRARQDAVKMIEIKLSQGAKPGHGGVLPAIKNTPEIAAARAIKPHTRVKSPSAHSAFQDAAGLLRFVQRLRELSGGKPVGFKLCLGRPAEFTDICLKIKETGIHPDFITVDGAEGGTGAAPLEFTDAVGIPLYPALTFIHAELQRHGLRGSIRLIASGKVVTAASLVRCLCLGADLCNSARAFMLSLGCIQALRCDKNTCPTGIATQDPALIKGLVVADKRERVANFHRNTVEAVLEIMAACGARSVEELGPHLILDGRPWSGWGGAQAG